MILVRVAANEVAVYGVLIHGRTPFAVTLERPWRNNERNVSCIPPGPEENSSITYACRRVNSPRFGDTFEVTNVPGRKAILFHKGNLDDDTQGCILVGEAFNPVLGRPGITQSGDGFGEFMKLTQMVNSFPLEIVNAYSRYQASDWRRAVQP